MPGFRPSRSARHPDAVKRRTNPRLDGHKRCSRCVISASLLALCWPLTGCAVALLDPVEVASSGRSATSNPGSSELLRQSVSGYNRICVYRSGPLLGQESTLRVGMADRCPANYRTNEPTTAPPPTAGLVSQTLAGGIRSCVYSELGNRWTIELPQENACPLSAGMARAAAVDPNRR